MQPNFSAADSETVKSLLLETWQPVAAIAVRAKLPVCTALKIINHHLDAWNLQRARVRIDSKNRVHCFRIRVRPVCVMGVWMPLCENVESEESA